MVSNFEFRIIFEPCPCPQFQKLHRSEVQRVLVLTKRWPSIHSSSQPLALFSAQTWVGISMQCLHSWAGWSSTTRSRPPRLALSHRTRAHSGCCRPLSRRRAAHSSAHTHPPPSSRALGQGCRSPTRGNAGAGSTRCRQAAPRLLRLLIVLDTDR